MLRGALDRLQGELPDTVKASIQPEDEQFALDTLHRQRSPENPTSAARRAAAGIAWERVLAARLRSLVARYDTVHVLAERWLPPNARIDLDLIVADDTKGLAWIIDAKNSNPNDDQLAKMRDQIRLLKRSPKTSGERPIIGVIVHTKHQLDPPVQATDTTTSSAAPCEDSPTSCCPTACLTHPETSAILTYWGRGKGRGRPVGESTT